MAVDTHRPRERRSTLGYSIVLLGAALFVTSCFLPYYGFPGAQSVSLYDQLLVAQDGGLELGAKLFLFGGVATVLVVALVGLMRGARQSGRGLLAGAVSAWSLTWIGSLLQSAGLREGATIPRGLSLETGFWLQAVSIGVAVIGTILVATRRTGAHEHGCAGHIEGRHGHRTRRRWFDRVGSLRKARRARTPTSQRLDALGSAPRRRTAPRPHAAP